MMTTMIVTNLLKAKETQSRASAMDCELQRLSLGVRYAVPLPGSFHLWDMLKDASRRFPAFPREVDLVGTYDVFYVASYRSEGLFARTTRGVTKGTLQLSIRGRIKSENGRFIELADYLLSVKCLEGKLSLDNLTEEHDVSDFCIEQTERTETSHDDGGVGRCHPGSIGIRVHPSYQCSKFAGASLYIVGHHCAIPFPSTKTHPNAGRMLSREKGQELLDHYEDGISATMHLNLPVEICRLVRDFIGPPPILMVEPGDLVLSIHNHQTMLARPCHKKQPPPPPFSIWTMLKYVIVVIVAVVIGSGGKNLLNRRNES